MTSHDRTTRRTGLTVLAVVAVVVTATAPLAAAGHGVERASELHRSTEAGELQFGASDRASLSAARERLGAAKPSGPIPALATIPTEANVTDGRDPTTEEGQRGCNATGPDGSDEADRGPDEVDGGPDEADGSNGGPDGAAKISLGKDVRGTLAADEDVDRYRFAAEAGQAIRILPSDDGTLQTKVTLYGPDGRVLAEMGDVPTKYVFSLGAAAEETGTYTVEVRRRNADAGRYELRVDARDSDRVEPYENAANDDRRSALALEGSNATLTGVLAQAEEDWYAVELDAGDRLDLTLTHAEQTLPIGDEMEIDVFAADGTDVGSLDGEAKRTIVPGPAPAKLRANQTFVADASGTYYVRIRGYRGSVNGFAEYELAAATTSAGPGTTASNVTETTGLGDASEQTATTAVTATTATSTATGTTEATAKAAENGTTSTDSDADGGSAATTTAG